MNYAKFFALLLILAGIVAAATQPSAFATPGQDQDLYQTLYRNGIAPGVNAVTGAHQVCADVWTGTDPNTEVSRIWKMNPTFDWDSANLFVFTAIRIYCPPTGSGSSSGSGATV